MSEKVQNSATARVNEQQIDLEDKEGDLQDSCSTLGLSYKYVILKFHDHSVTYFGDKQACATRKLKVRLWYDLPVDRNRRVMASFKPGDSGGLPC